MYFYIIFIYIYIYLYDITLLYRDVIFVRFAKVDPQELMKAKAVPGVTWMAKHRPEILLYVFPYEYTYLW